MRLRRLVVATLVCTALLGVSVGTASVAGDGTASARTAGGDSFCLVTKEDYSVEDQAIEVTEQTAQPLEVEGFFSETHQYEDKDWLIYETDYMFAEKMCAALDTGPSPVKITLTDVRIRNLTVNGPAMDTGFRYGESDEIVLWISLKSALKLFPTLIGSGATQPPRDVNSTSAVSSPPVGTSTP